MQTPSYNYFQIKSKYYYNSFTTCYFDLKILHFKMDEFGINNSVLIWKCYIVALLTKAHDYIFFLTRIDLDTTNFYITNSEKYKPQIVSFEKCFAC